MSSEISNPRRIHSDGIYTIDELCPLMECERDFIGDLEEFFGLSRCIRSRTKQYLGATVQEALARYSRGETVEPRQPPTRDFMRERRKAVRSKDVTE